MTNKSPNINVNTHTHTHMNIPFWLVFRRNRVKQVVQFLCCTCRTRIRHFHIFLLLLISHISPCSILEMICSSRIQKNWKKCEGKKLFIAVYSVCWITIFPDCHCEQVKWVHIVKLIIIVHSPWICLWFKGLRKEWLHVFMALQHR